MLPQFTCPRCSNHQLTLTTYVRCDQNVEIGINNIRYEVNRTDYDETSPNLTRFHCSHCNHTLTNDHNEDITTEKELITYLHHQDNLLFLAGML